MTKEFIVVYTDWHGRKDTFFCHASDAASARKFAYWTLSEFIDIHDVEEIVD